MRKLSAVALTATLMGVVAFGSIANAGTKLNLSVPDAASSSIGVAAQEFADQLNEKSGGELEVTVYFDGSLYGGDATAAVTTMQDGGLDMLCLATSWYASFDDSFNVIQIPYLFKNVDAEQAFLNDPASQPMWDAVEGMGVKFLAAWTRSFRMTTNNVRPITKPEDFAFNPSNPSESFGDYVCGITLMGELISSPCDNSETGAKSLASLVFGVSQKEGSGNGSDSDNASDSTEIDKEMTQLSQPTGNEDSVDPSSATKEDTSTSENPE